MASADLGAGNLTTWEGLNRDREGHQSRKGRFLEGKATTGDGGFVRPDLQRLGSGRAKISATQCDEISVHRGVRRSSGRVTASSHTSLNCGSPRLGAGRSASRSSAGASAWPRRRTQYWSDNFSVHSMPVIHTIGAVASIPGAGRSAHLATGASWGAGRSAQMRGRAILDVDTVGLAAKGERRVLRCAGRSA